MQHSRFVYWWKCSLVVVGVPLALYAYASGPPARSTGAPGEQTCSQSGCHVGTAVNSTNGAVQIAYSGGTSYVPGERGKFTVTITDRTTRQRWGFQASARLASNLQNGQAGSLIAVSGTEVQCEDGRTLPCRETAAVQFINHSAASTQNTFEFEWTAPAAGAGNVQVFVASNAANGDGGRSGDRIYTANITLTPQASLPCTFSLSSSSISSSAAAGNAVVLIQASRAGCAWSGWSNSSFLTLMGATAGSSSGSVTVNYSANTGAGRTGTVTIGGQTFTVTQSGTCDFSLRPGTISTSATGGVYNATLTLMGTQCRWVVQQPPSVTANPGEGNTAGIFNQSFTVYPNFSTQARSLSVYVENAAMTISQSGNPLTSNERFVQLVYFAFLGRLPAAAELASQSASLIAGTSRDDMIVTFFASDEFNAKGRFVAGLYVGLLNRDAEFNGWIFQRGALQNGVVTLSGLVTNFINSLEFQLQNGALRNEDYVRLLYRQVLLREPTASEVSGQAAALSIGVTTRTNMAYGFLASSEFQGGTGPRLTAFLLYAGLLQRDATTAERSILMAQIQFGTTVRAAALNILNSNEFGDFLK